MNVERPFGDEDLDILQTMNGFGRVLTVAGKCDQTEKILWQTVKRRRKVTGEKHAYTLGSIANFAQVYESLQKFDQAEPLLAHVAQKD